MMTSMRELNNRHYIILGLIAAALFCIAAMSRNYYLFEIFCQKNYDFGIFVEVIRENAKGEINPWLNTRQIYQFSDHWTVIMSLISPFAKIFSAHHVALWGEMLCYFLSGIVLIVLALRKRVDPGWMGLLLVFLFLNRDLYETAYFPIHESAMAIFPLMWFGALISRWRIDQPNNLLLKAELIFLSLLLCLFSEQFGFAIFGLALALLIFTREKVFSLLYLLISLALIWWLSVGRAEVFTPIFPYYQQRILVSFSGILSRYEFSFSEIKTFILHFVGMSPLIYVLWKNRSTASKNVKPLILATGLFGPLILGRVIAANFNHQYIVPIIVYWIVICFVLVPFPKITKKVFIISSLFFLIWSNNKIRKPFQTILLHKELDCARGEISGETLSRRQKRIETALLILENHVGQNNFNILANANFLPNLLIRFPRAEVFQLGSYRILSVTSFDWALIEAEPFGESHYVSPANVLAVQKKLKDENLEVVYESDGLMLVRGPIKKEWFEDLYVDHPEHYISNPRTWPPGVKLK